MASYNVQKALQYNLHSDWYYTALNQQDTSGTPKGFYSTGTNKHKVVLDEFVKIAA